MLCNITWASNYQSNLDCLVKLQKKILRVISFSQFNAHTESLFDGYRIMKFENLNRYLTAIYMFKIFKGLVPAIIQNIFSTNVDVHSHNTRQRHNFHMFSCRTNLLAFSIKYHGPKIWNQLPLTLHQIVSSPLFKRKLKIYYS